MAEPKGLAALIAEQDAELDQGYGPALPSREEMQQVYDHNQKIAGMQKGDYMTPEYGEVDTSMGSFQSGFNRFARGALEGTAQHIRGGKLLDQAAGDEGYVSADVEDYIADAVDSGARQIDINPLQTGHGQTLAGAGGSAVSFMAPQMGAAGVGAVLGGTVGSLGGPGGAAAGAVRGAQLGGRLGAPITAYLGRNMMMKNLYDDYVQTTGTEPTMEELQVMAEESKAGYLEALGPTAGMNKAFGAGKGFIKHALGTGALEGGTEMVQEGISQGVVNKVAKEKLAYDEDRNLLDGVVEQASVGGQVGFIMGAAMSMLGARGRYKQRMYEEATEDAVKEETGEALAEASKSVQKDIEAQQKADAKEREAVNKAAQDSAVDKAADDLKGRKPGVVEDEQKAQIPPQNRARGKYQPYRRAAAKKVSAARERAGVADGSLPAKQQVADRVNTLRNVSNPVRRAAEKQSAVPVRNITPEAKEILPTVTAIQKENVSTTIPEATGNPTKDAGNVIRTIGAVKQQTEDDFSEFETVAPTQTPPPAELTEETDTTVDETGRMAAMERRKKRLMKQLMTITQTMGKRSNALDYVEVDEPKTAAEKRINAEILERRAEYSRASRELVAVSRQLQRAKSQADPEYTAEHVSGIRKKVSNWTAGMINEHKIRPPEVEPGPTVAPQSETDMQNNIVYNELEGMIKTIGQQFDEDPTGFANAISKNKKITIKKLKAALDYFKSTGDNVSYAAKDRRPALLNNFLLHYKKYNRTPKQNLRAIANLTIESDKKNGMSKKMQGEYNRLFKSLFGTAINLPQIRTIQDPAEKSAAAGKYVNQRIEDVAYGREELTEEAKDAENEARIDDVLAALEAKGYKVSGDNTTILLNKDDPPDSFIADNLPATPADVETAKKKLEAMFTQTITTNSFQPGVDKDGATKEPGKKTIVSFAGGNSLTVPWQEVAAYGEAVADGSLGIHISSGQMQGADKFILRFAAISNNKHLEKHPLRAVKGIVTEDYISRDEIAEQMEFDAADNVFTEDEFGTGEDFDETPVPVQDTAPAEMAPTLEDINDQLAEAGTGETFGGPDNFLPIVDTKGDTVTSENFEEFMGGSPGKPSEGAAPQSKSSVVDSIDDAQLYAIDYDKLSPQDRHDISWRLILDKHEGSKRGVLNTAVDGDVPVIITTQTKTQAGHHRTKVIRAWTAEELGGMEGSLLDSQIKSGHANWTITEQLNKDKPANKADIAKQKKAEKIEKEAEALRKEIREIEDSGIPYEDDIVYSKITARAGQMMNNRMARGGVPVADTLTLGGRGKKHALSDLLETLSDNMPDGPEKILVDRLRTLKLTATVHVEDLPVWRTTDTLGNVKETRARGSYSNGQIKIDPETLIASPSEVSYVLIHEAVHAATRRALITNKVEAERMAKLFNEVRRHQKDAPRGVSTQIFDNMDELLVYAMTDYQAQDWLNTLPSVDPETGKPVSWLRNFMDTVARMVGLTPREGFMLNDIMRSSNRLFYTQDQINEAKGLTDDLLKNASIADLVPEEDYYDRYALEDAHNVPLRKFIKTSKYKDTFYHYMTNAWEKIDLAKTELGLHLGTKKAAEDRAKIVRGWKQDANETLLQGQKVEEFYIDVRKVFKWRDIGNFGDPIVLYKTLLHDLKTNRPELQENKPTKKLMDELAAAGQAMLESLRSRPMLEPKEREGIFNALVRNAFMNAGYDAISYENRVEDPGSESVVLLTHRAKASSAKNFSRDDLGNIYDDFNTPSTGVQMSAGEVIKAKKLEAQFQKGAKAAGLDLTVLWNGDQTIPEGFAQKINQLVDERNFVRLKGTRGWINLETKEVILFPQNIPSLKEFEKVMTHEVIGHFSMEELFGSRYNKFLENMVKNPHWKPLIDEKMATYNLNRKEGDKINEITAAKEVIARMSETHENPKLWKRVVAWVRHQFRRLGLQNVSENDVANYISQASKKFMEGNLPNYDYYGGEIMDSYVGKLVSGGMVSDLKAIESRNTMHGVLKQFVEKKIANIDEISGTAYAKAVKPSWDWVSNQKFAQYYSHLKGLSHKDAYQYVRQVGLGTSSNYDREAARIFKTLNGLNDDQKNTLYDFFKTAGAELPHDWGTAKEIETANDAKQIIFKLGEELAELEYLDPKTFAANADTYLPRMYLSFIVDPDKAAAIYGGGSKVSLQNYLKQIKIKLEEDGSNAQAIKEIETAMGLVQDPVLLATNSIAMVGRDVALVKMMDGISYASSQMGGEMWAIPKMKGVKLPGMVKAKDPMSILAEVEHNRKHVLTHRSGKEKLRAAKLYDAQEKEARKLLEKEGLQDVDVSRYKYIDSSRRNGALSGRWVRDEIYNDIRASYVAFASEDPSGFERVLGQYSGLTKANRVWKNTKTVWNLPTHARNLVGNFVNLDISTSTSTFKLFNMAIEEGGKFLEATANQTKVADMDYWWQIADKLGITETTFTAQEAQTALRQWKAAVKDSDHWTKGMPTGGATEFLVKKLPWASQRGAKLADIMGGLYQASETLFKVVKLRDTIQRYEAVTGVDLKSMPDEVQRDAIESMMASDAQKWIFDYSAVPRTIRYLRNAPIGAPFISFAYLALPRMFESAMKHPGKFLQYTAAPFVLGHVAAMLGAFPEDDDDWDKVKAKLPDYMRDKYSIVPLPWKDEYGNREFVDVGYFIPFSPYIEAGRAYSDKFLTNKRPDMPLTDPILNMGILSGPTPDLITAWKTGIDPFTQQPIVNKYGTSTEKFTDVLNYGWTMAAPTFLTEKGWLGKSLQVLTDANKNYNVRTGEKKQGVLSSQLRAIGVNTTSPNLQDSRNTNVRFMKAEISKIKAAASKEVKQARAAGATMQDQAKIRKKYMEKLKLYRKNLQDYMKETN